MSSFHAVPASTRSVATLSRVLFAYRRSDPGLPEGYARTLDSITASWASALGIDPSTFATAAHVRLPDVISERAEYSGSLRNASLTRGSRVAQIDVSPATHPGVAMRVLQFDHVGHFWPSPNLSQYDMSQFVENWGLRNQDIDMADAIWDYFRQASKQMRKGCPGFS